MRLTAHSDYALRVLIYLAIKNNKKSTINEISETYHISKEHLRKIVHKLVKENYINSTRGRTGGLTLKQPPENINLGTVIRATEADFNIVECFDPQTNNCILKGSCKLQNILNEALHAFINTLDQYTLQDLITPQNPLRQTLEL